MDVLPERMEVLPKSKVSKKQGTELLPAQIFGDKQSLSADFPFAKGGPCAQLVGGDMLSRDNMPTEGLAFLGLSLTQNHIEEGIGHPNSVTRQVQFDLNKIQDRSYQFFQSTNDDGWLLGGGESSTSWKLENLDSAHCEIVRMGTLNSATGGLSPIDLERAIVSGEILIPEFHILPTSVIRNGDTPPEIELRFDLMQDNKSTIEEWANWQFVFVMNQVYERFQFPGRFTPGPFHSTIVRKAVFRSADTVHQYFKKCSDVVADWQSRGPKVLSASDEKDIVARGKRPGGLYVFKDRNTIIGYHEPNFLPPYNTDEKRAIISKVLSRRWDVNSLSWKPAEE